MNGRAAWLTAIVAVLSPNCKRHAPEAAPEQAQEEVVAEPPEPATKLSHDWRRVRASTRSPHLAEIVDNIAVLRLEGGDLTQLTAEDRRRAYWLQQAALAAQEIIYEQRGPQNLALKELVERVLGSDAAFPAPELARLRVYAKKLWLSQGNRDAWSGQLLVPELPPLAMERLLGIAIDAGVKLPRFNVLDRATLRLAWPKIQRALYGTLEKAGGDPTARDDSGSSKGTLRSREAGALDRRRVAPEPIARAGGEGLLPGLYGEALGRVRQALRRAIRPEGRGADQELVALDEYLRTGELTAFDRLQRAEASAALPELLFGALGGSAEVRDRVGAFRVLALVKAGQPSNAIQKMLEHRGYFEGRLLREALPEADSSTSTGAQVTSAWPLVVLPTGGSELPTVVGWPPDPGARAEAGGRWYWLGGLLDLSAGFALDALVRELTYDPADLADAERCTVPAWAAHAAMKEMIGPAARPNASDGRAALFEYAPAIEQARLELVPLHLFADPKLVELEVIPDDRCSELHATHFVQSLSLDLAARGRIDELPDDRLRAKALIVQYAKDRGAVEVMRSQGRHFLVVEDLPRWKLAVETLLFELMRVEAAGDYSAAKQLVERYGRKAPAEWGEDAARRLSLLGIPTRKAVLTPRLAPLYDSDGRVVDARLVEGLSLEATALSDAGVRPLP